MIPFFKRVRTGPHPHYRAAARKGTSGKKEAAETRFIVLDTETSGFKISSDRILSVAAFEVVNGVIRLSAGRKWIVFQPESRPTPATAIHGILPSETEKGVPEKQMLEELIPMLTGAVVVGHHMRFDAAMLNAALMRHFKIRFCSRILDTAHLAMRELVPFHKTGYANQRPPSLDEVCSQLNLPLTARHTAEGDAFLTAQLFLLLCGKIRRRLNRPLQLRDLPLKTFRI
jgi:DNA polymerase-3 subunit epsilon